MLLTPSLKERRGQGGRGLGEDALAEHTLLRTSTMPGKEVKKGQIPFDVLHGSVSTELRVNIMNNHDDNHE